MTITDHTATGKPLTAAPTGWYPSGGKRVVDLVTVIPVVVLASPLLVVAALALRIELGRGIVLRQRRVGREATVFTMFKFRTMEHSRRTNSVDRRGIKSRLTGTDRRHGHKSPHDPRHTALGRILRKFSIDELPQLVNVLRGDMSLVGPRPQLADVASPSFRAHPRHLVRPGLTGPFQVSPMRSGGSLDAGLGIDADYVQNLSFRNDVKFLCRTVAALVRGTGN